jgi:hypothetical protein
MVRLDNTLQAWGSSQFETVFKAEIAGLEKQFLPLQAGLAHSNRVSASPFQAVVLASSETPDCLTVKTAIFYTGVNSGSCCADDPTPVCEENEYCELQFDIDKRSAVASITLL